MKYFSTKIINKENLLHNYDILSTQCNKKIISVVKANAYGHGSISVVNLLKEHCEYFAVQNLEEALLIRQHFSNVKILIVGKCIDFKIAVDNDIDITIDSMNEILLIEQLQLFKIARVHLKVNIGMNRLGVSRVNEFNKIIRYLNSSKHIKIVGVSSHFPNTKQKNITEKQLKRFKNYINHINDKNIIIHVGGSGMVNYNLPDWISAVRCGIALYGYCNKQTKKVMKIKSRVVKTLFVKKGESVGYDNGFITECDSQIAIIPLGYADGINRALKDKLQIEINGKRVAQIGNICMDMFMCDVTDCNIKENDECVIFDDATILSTKLNTIEYEILTSFNQIRADNVIE